MSDEHGYSSADRLWKAALLKELAVAAAGGTPAGCNGSCRFIADFLD